jgi:hypothetical protein
MPHAAGGSEHGVQPQRDSGSLWADARRSLLTGAAALLGAALVLGVFVLSMPPLQVGWLG